MSSGIAVTVTGVSCNAVQIFWTDGTETAVYYNVYRNLCSPTGEGECTYGESPGQWIGNVYTNQVANADYQNSNGWDVTTGSWLFNDDQAGGDSQYAYTVEGVNSDGSTYSSTVDSDSEILTLSCFSEENFNCDCESWPNANYSTLAALQTRMYLRLGYAAVASNPPAGLAALCAEFLTDAQQQLWRTYKELHTERFLAWTMVPGQRFYGLSADNAACSGQALDPLKVTWVGFEDLNMAWYSLVEGIDPVLYTRATITLGWPTRYEIRSCIEIFPAPRAAYTLWIKGHFGLQSFVNPTDTTTIDSEAVFLLALGNAKSHYGQPDAQNLLDQADNYVKNLVKEMHGTKRYVPRVRVEEPQVPPRFLPLHGAPA